MKLRSFIRKYRFELTVGLIAVIAIALLLAGDQTNGAKGWMNQILTLVGQFFTQTIEVLRLDLEKLRPSDFFALGVLIVVAVLILWRIRWRVSNAPKFNVKMCPRCGRKLHRAHRTWLDRLFGSILVLDLKRYKCVDKKCGWNGLVTAKSRMMELEPIIDEPG